MDIEFLESEEVQRWPLPSSLLPIFIVGAGKVVREAHLPSYKKLGFPLLGFFDPNLENLNRMSRDFHIPSFGTLDELIAESKKHDLVIFDVATPPGAFEEILRQLPLGSNVLLQKPFGKDYHMAYRLMQICRKRNLSVAVNHQFRFSPNILALREAIQRGILGDLSEVSCIVKSSTPFDQWTWMQSEARVEGLYHSVHYVDVLQWLLGPMKSVRGGVWSSPSFPTLRDTRMTALLDPCQWRNCRCLIMTSHDILSPLEHSWKIQVKGSRGSAVLTFPRNFDYPHNSPDELFFAFDDHREDWQGVTLRGSWNPEAFEGPMSNLQRFVLGQDTQLVSSVEETLGTMATLEAIYQSNDKVVQVCHWKQPSTSMLTIVGVEVRDIRFPTSKESHGSDAMHLDPDYSCAYVTLHTNSDICGNGLTFTLGRGTEIVRKGVESLKGIFEGASLESLTQDMKSVVHHLTSDSQLRWLGPEKGVIHLAAAALLNALWDLWAKAEGKPLWKLLIDLPSSDLLKCLDLSYVSDVLSSEEALEILERQRGSREENIRKVKEEGIPAYTTSIGWYGYSEEKVRHLCRDAIEDGWQYFKMKVGADLETDVRRAKVIREEIGWEKVLMMDANQRWSIPQAIENMKALSSFRPLWIEEPTSPDDILGHAKISEAIKPIGVATGEQCHNRIMFKQFFQANAFDYCQTDSCRLASVNENIVVMLLAAKFKIPVCPHAGGVGLCEYVQHLAAFDAIALSGPSSFRLVEYVDHLHEHFENPVEIRRGRYLLPQSPGYSTDFKAQSIIDFEFPFGTSWKSPRDI